MRKVSYGPPVDPLDSVSRGYVDNLATQLFALPPVGWVIGDGSSLSNNTSGALTANRANFHRLYLGPATYDALYVHCTAAQSGGTTSLLAGIYPDDGTGTWPDTSAAAPLAQVGNTSPFSLLGTGMRPGVFTTPWVNTTWDVFWVCSLYLAPTAPTTAATLSAVNNNLQNLATPSSLTIGSVARGYYSTGLSALPVSSARTTSTLLVSVNNDITALKIRRSA